jgi:hypothetical protein
MRPIFFSGGGASGIIERSLLPDRPAFFTSAGRRGCGKTTTLTMLIMAVTGLWPAAAAWSTNDEERRKALMSYFLLGVPYILWDNIARGTQISCPHIEKSCTSAFYFDRQLGVSKTICTSAATIHHFTGNNIGAKGDLASRSLHIRLDADRADPENRGSSTRTRLPGRGTTAPKSWPRSTPSCSGTRSSGRHRMRRPRPGLKCGGAWSGRGSSTRVVC